MFNSTTLEVAIGMAFIYLLLSLFCTAINEGLAGILGSRATNLERGLLALFSEVPAARARKDSEPANATVSQSTTPFTDAIYAHGLVQSLYQSGRGAGITKWWGGGKRLPSYIPARTFGSVLLDHLFPEVNSASASGPPTAAERLKSMLDKLSALPDGKAKQAMVALVRQANGDLVATRRSFEGWFNDGMDRASGWYKRKTQLVLFGIGLGLAFMLNIDSINVARTLWVNPALRSYAIAAATSYATTAPLKPAAEGSPSLEPLRRLQDLAVPIGWNGDGPLQWVRNQNLPHIHSAEALCFAVAGWLLTAIAMTLGAPFWFDTLNQFMVVRSTIKPSEKSETEASKDPTNK